MSNYSKSVDFAAKDALITGNPSKVVRGTEINTEYANIETAVNSKLNIAAPAFTGTQTGVAITLTGTLTANLIDGGSY